MSAPNPGYDRGRCPNCGTLTRNPNTYCDACTAKGYGSGRDHIHSGLSLEALGVSMALSECGIPSGIQNFSFETKNFETNNYDCSNGYGRKVQNPNTMCDNCLAGNGPPFDNAGLAHEALGVNISYAEYGATSAIQGISDHGSAAYPCKNPSCGNKVQERGDLCAVCVAGA